MKTLTFSILTVALAFALTGCKKGDNNDPTTTGEIAFVNLNDRLVPRGANDASSNFGVYAIYRNDNTYGNGWLMDNLTVNGRNYSYSPPKFWPTQGVVDFYSYAPASTSNLNLSGVNYGTGANAKFMATYTVGTEAQEDFTIAMPALGINYKGEARTVELVFSHALSQVKFNVMMDANTVDAANYTLVVNSVRLDVPFDRNTVSLSTQSWGATPSRSAEYRPYGGATNAGHYNILPQILSAQNSATITADITLTDNITGETYIDGNLKPIVLDGTLGDFAQFEPGKSYTFAMKVGITAQDANGNPIFDPISFDANLSPWAETPVTIN